VIEAGQAQATVWPSELREHATFLCNYLRDALLCIEFAKEQLITTPLVKTMIAAISVVLTKVENAPGYTTVMQTLTTIQNDLKTTTTAVKLSIT
jgi:hypothetical protein